jgi:hypothetical protein
MQPQGAQIETGAANLVEEDDKSMASATTKVPSLYAER